MKKRIFWSLFYSLLVYFATWLTTGDFSMFPLGVAMGIITYTTWQVKENWETYKQTRRYEIPRQTGAKLWLIIVIAPDREALFDALNVSHDTRKRIELFDRMMRLPPAERRRILDVVDKEKDE